MAQAIDLSECGGRELEIASGGLALGRHEHDAIGQAGAATTPSVTGRIGAVSSTTQSYAVASSATTTARGVGAQ